MNSLLIVLLLFGSRMPGAAQAVDQPAITVAVGGAHSDQGEVRCALYASASGFPKKPGSAQMLISTSLRGGKGVCRFAGVAAGRYAVSVFHDENGNGKLDTNFLGIPKEGVGASNDASGHFGPPKFDDAAFDYAGGKFSLTVHLHYL